MAKLCFQQAAKLWVKSQRKEYIFLKDTMKYLQDRGILIYIIPQKRLNEKITKLLSLHFQDIQVFRFQEEEYEIFKQIVLFGTKKEKPEVDLDIYQKLLEAPLAELPAISMQEHPLYDIPQSQEVPFFRSTVINFAELEKSLEKSSLRSKLDSLMTSQALLNNSRPPLPLRTGHLALVLSSGYLDGEVSVTAHCDQYSVCPDTDTLYYISVVGADSAVRALIAAIHTNESLSISGEGEKTQTCRKGLAPMKSFTAKIKYNNFTHGICLPNPDENNTNKLKDGNTRASSIRFFSSVLHATIQ